MNVFVYPQRAALIDLEHGIVKLCLAAEGAAGYERGRNAGVGVRACAVIEHLEACVGQNVKDHVAAGGFSVCAGDGYYGFGLVNPAEEIGAELYRKLAGEIACVHAQKLLQPHGELSEYQGNYKSQILFHLSLPFEIDIILYYISLCLSLSTCFCFLDRSCILMYIIIIRDWRDEACRGMHM